MQVKATILAHRGNLEAAEEACADLPAENGSPYPGSSSSSQRKGRCGQEEDDILLSLQKRVKESGELLQALANPRESITETAAFANYVRDSLITMPKRKFKKARTQINAILTHLMSEDSDEEVHTIRTNAVPASGVVQHPSAPPTASTSYKTPWELCQPPPHMWTRQPPAASVWGSQTADYVHQYLQQPLEPQVQQKQSQDTQQSPSGTATSSHSFGNLSGLSAVLDLSGLDGRSSPSEHPRVEISTPQHP